MKKKYCLLPALLFSIYCNFLFSDISFVSADLNRDGDILFSVRTGVLNSFTYDTLFLYSKEKNKTEQLTFFAEKMNFFKSSNTLQIINRFGIMRMDADSGKAEIRERFSAQLVPGSLNFQYLESVGSSPDGRWLTVIEPVSPVYGKLTLIDTVTEKRHILIEKAVRNSNPVCWAPDSKTLLYEDGSVLYFARPEWFMSGQPLDKRFRRLGEGRVKNVRWTSASEFIFLSGNVFYQVNSTELFTKSLYFPLFQAGEFTARLPMEFDGNADSVFISPSGSGAVFISGGRNVCFLKLTGDDYADVKEPFAIPYLLLPGSTAAVSVYWKNDLPIIFSESVSGGKNILTVRRLSSRTAQFEKAAVFTDAVLLSASPDFKMAVIKENGTASFYDTAAWKKSGAFNEENIFSAVWKDSRTVFFGGEKTLYRCTLDSGGALSDKRRINITSVQDYGWSETGKKILSKTNGDKETAEYAGRLLWKDSEEKTLFKKNASNAEERIYIDSGVSYFKNMIYIRSLKNFTTRPLFEEPPGFASRLNNPGEDAYGNSSSVFSHGNRKGKKQVALVFDAMESTDGIAEVLYALKKYGIKATFFINGEALKRNPEAVKEIVKAGHPCGSLFFTAWNLNDTNYGIDESFIRQGLAKNEDGFYALTGSELSLIWHSPNYIASPMIINAGKKAGYIYISPDIRIPDWADSKTENVLPGFRKSPADIIEDIYLSALPGSIIPIRLGKTNLKKKDYLYLHTELLITVLAEAGYSFTDVKTLMSGN